MTSRPEASGHLRPTAVGPTIHRVMFPSPVVASYAGRNFFFGKSELVSVWRRSKQKCLFGSCGGLGFLDLGLKNAGQAGAGFAEGTDELCCRL